MHQFENPFYRFYSIHSEDKRQSYQRKVRKNHERGLERFFKSIFYHSVAARGTSLYIRNKSIFAHLSLTVLGSGAFSTYTPDFKTAESYRY